MTESITLAHTIGGAQRAGAGAFEQRNPADEADLAVIGPEADAVLVAEAVATARAAQARLVAAGVEARADALAQIGRALIAEKDRLALLIARETGKTLGDAGGEVVRAARIFDFFAGEALRIVGERFDSTRPGLMVEVMKEPLGVVGLITPWNFPIAIPAWKIAPAIAYGNGVVWKPSEVSSATAEALMRIITNAALPAGCVNMILGARGAGQALVADADVDAISFTGSASVGAGVRSVAAARGARVQLELGGVNGFIVAADADLDVAVEAVLNGAFFASGQRCTATSRIIVENAIADDFAARLAKRASALVIGDPRGASTQLGPLAGQRFKRKVVAQTKAAAGRLHVVFGGAEQDLGACFFAPTLFDGARADDPLVNEEIFGPVAALYRVNDWDEAIASLNASKFGLSAGAATRSLAQAEDFKRRAKAGMRMVNLPTAGVDYHAPFGGVGESSYGPREQGRAASSFYTTTTTTYVRAS